MLRFECEKRACEDGGRSQERQPARCGGLRIYGNPERDISHASNFRSALRCVLPVRVYHQVRVKMHLYLARRCGFVADAKSVQQRREDAMNQKAISLAAGVVFGLIALGHVLRIVLGWSFTIQDFSVPMWASGLAVVVMGYLSYEGFRLARPSGV